MNKSADEGDKKAFPNRWTSGFKYRGFSLFGKSSIDAKNFWQFHKKGNSLKISPPQMTY